MADLACFQRRSNTCEPPQWILSDSESTFEIQMVSYFFESEVKCQNPKRGKTSEDLFDLIQ